MTDHVLTSKSTQSLGIIDSEGRALEHTSTLAQVAAAAESTHADMAAAIKAALISGGERYVIDGSGDSHYISSRWSDHYSLYDSELNDRITADDLGCSEDDYEALIEASMTADQHEGHVRVGSRRVYAQ